MWMVSNTDHILLMNLYQAQLYVQASASNKTGKDKWSIVPSTGALISLTDG